MEGSKCQQWAGRVLLAGFERRSCQLGGPMRGSVRSHLEQHCPTELSVMTEMFTSALLDLIATHQSHAAPDNLKRSKFD